ncbi:hypothetical protein CDIMF43_60019 [Carnobacterium divergens]|nr:hypothetical protein CDIMF43_60019 [Carnobacterium divergens]
MTLLNLRNALGILIHLIFQLIKIPCYIRYWYSVTIYYITVSNFFVTETKIIKPLFCAILSS